MSKGEEKHQESRKGSTNMFFIIVFLAQLGVSVFFTLALLRLGILHTTYLLLAIGALAVLLALSTFLLLKPNHGKVAKTIGVILSIITIAGCLYAYKYVSSATSFFSEITEEEQYEVQVYEVRAPKSSGITTLSQLNGQKIGFISTNPNLDETKAKLSESLVNYEPVEYEEIGGMLAGLYDQQVPAVVIGQSYLNFLEEIGSTFETDTVVLHTISITVKDLDLRQPVDMLNDPFIVYISGSDSRGTINDVADSDVNILAVVNPEKGKILLVNIPRDYQIQIYGTTGLKDKLKSAGLFGIETSKKTIEELLDIKINYVMKVGFQAVRQLVDAIDGIDIESDQALTIIAGDESPTSGYREICYIQEGINHLDGACALRYARERKSFEDGDLDRGVHQQAVLTAIINKVTNLHYITRLPQILNAAKDTFQTSFTEKEVTDFVRWQLGELKHWKIKSIQIGTSDHVLEPTYTYRTQNMWMYLRDEASENKAKQKITEYLESEAGAGVEPE